MIVALDRDTAMRPRLAGAQRVPQALQSRTDRPRAARWMRCWRWPRRRRRLEVLWRELQPLSFPGSRGRDGDDRRIKQQRNHQSEPRPRQPNPRRAQKAASRPRDFVEIIRDEKTPRPPASRHFERQLAAARSRPEIGVPPRPPWATAADERIRQPGIDQARLFGRQLAGRQRRPTQPRRLVVGQRLIGPAPTPDRVMRRAVEFTAALQVKHQLLWLGLPGALERLRQTQVLRAQRAGSMSPATTASRTRIVIRQKLCAAPTPRVPRRVPDSNQRSESQQRQGPAAHSSAAHRRRWRAPSWPAR